jgi:hypothetical protein
MMYIPIGRPNAVKIFRVTLFLLLTLMVALSAVGLARDVWATRLSPQARARQYVALPAAAAVTEVRSAGPTGNTVVFFTLPETCAPEEWLEYLLAMNPSRGKIRRDPYCIETRYSVETRRFEYNPERERYAYFILMGW